MKKDIHPKMREICFLDLSNNQQLIIQSTLQTKEKITLDDGREMPLYKVESSAYTHPFYTGTQKSIDNLGGRVDKFRQKFARAGAVPLVKKAEPKAE
jgi:large subunit ribosomal protein L31